VLTALAITKTVAEETFGVESTLNIILLTFLALARVLQTPMVMVALARIGLVNVQVLRKYRRYAGMGILLTGEITAPDASPVTMLLIAAPMYVSRGRAPLAGQRALFPSAPVRPIACVTTARVAAGRRQSRRRAQEGLANLRLRDLADDNLAGTSVIAPARYLEP